MENLATLETPSVSRLKIEKVSSRQGLKQFIDFPHDLFAGDPNYVPELFMAQEELLNKEKSPFFKHSTAEYFLAMNSSGT